MLRCLMVTMALLVSSLSAFADQLPAVQDKNNPSAELVSDFFQDVLKIVFTNQNAADGRARVDALKLVLAQTIDAGEIGRFILGRYAHGSQSPTPNLPVSDPASDFLDFAAHQIMRMAPANNQIVTADRLPSLTISKATERPDQTQMVFSELVWPDGHRLPLAWELADRPGSGLQIEDVSCLGISLRMMLRSAVAEAAAEHPEKRANLASLLDAGNALGRLPGAAAGNPPPAQ
jgi:hypothetical protein